MNKHLSQYQLAKLTVSPDAKLLEAMKAMDKGAKGVILIIDNYNKLLGLATDGDLRRALLKYSSLDIKISKIMNSSPKVVDENTSDEVALNLMRISGLNHLPILNKQSEVIDLFVLSDLVRETNVPDTAVIMAGGKGMRLRPLTTNTPKPMLDIENKPILLWIIESLKKYGISNIIISMREHHHQIEDYFKNGQDFGVNISYILEHNVLDTAGALGLLQPKPSKPFIVTNGDVLTTLDYTRFYNHHINNRAKMTVALHRYEFKVPYGVVNVKNTEVLSLSEKPSFSFYVNAGIYVISPEILELIPNNQALAMTDLIEILINSSLKVEAFPLMEYWIDIGQHSDYERAKTEVPNVFSDL